MTKIKGKRHGRPPRFDQSFKQQVVLDYYSRRTTLKATAAKFGISRSSVTNWIDAAENERQQLLTLKTMQPDNTDTIGTEPSNDDKNAADPAQLKAMQEELRLAKIKLACLETLIDITERDLGIDIRKKAGTRSSEE